MDDVIDMRFAQRRADLRHDVAEPLLGERPVVAQDEAQVLSLHVLHDDVERPVVFQPAEVEHLDDVRMVESAGRLRLALEASHQRRILEQLRLEHLERHRPLEREVAGPVHLAHPALPDEIVHAEAPGDDGAHERRGVRPRGEIAEVFAGCGAVRRVVHGAPAPST